MDVGSQSPSVGGARGGRWSARGRRASQDALHFRREPGAYQAPLAELSNDGREVRQQGLSSSLHALEKCVKREVDAGEDSQRELGIGRGLPVEDQRLGPG
jgi:hypothetical protein